MEVPVYNMAGEAVSQVELPEDIFGAPIKRGLMHQALVRQLANARRGTHKTKGRSEVRLTNRKIYRQKGTGNARHGSRRAPIFVGGGVAHGTAPRDYSQKMPRKMRRAALRSALSAKAQAGDIIVMDEVTLDAPKTKTMAGVQANVAGGHSALLLLAGDYDVVERSTRNLATMKPLNARYVNVRDVLGHDKIVVPLNALEVLRSYLGKESEHALA